MPQMAPISWLLLFFIFTITFIIFCSLNYYSYMPSSPKLNELNNIKLNSMNWKW
uniref:ATP synthase complex subunit 8 n=1 Tax=Drosophila mercatorum TaxID=7253 RepID=A0A5B9R2B4_DROMR|nr:ATP synthase F0 subunit 8 [Drosophila mercatorum]QEG54026.1 ATP synthase F0 subunit 8 [Drosophila mercatorum]UKE79680.1 ATP synthase F0 subunit 8 [Drosophila mercatorum]UKE79693.1 ATP synthase F0 subunit 8 [Drosophila mercatorum]UKE79706.1 ATP synthase F0 subunit 8 [Drosophila mercatorum]UKE79719.1 ATP synthase F0 subunit 8 [Drosophila mercatorum]